MEEIAARARPQRRIGRWLAAIAAALAALVILAFFYIGYLGDAVFADFPATGPARQVRQGTVAILLSGDMGLRVGMGPQIAGRLAKDGIAVVGVNSLAYYRTRRTPVETAALVEQAARRALALGKAERLILVGQSFGADMLHVGLARLPADLRRRVQLVALIVPENTVDYRASPSELFGFQKPDADALPTASKLDWVDVLCVRGIEETNSLCPLLNLPHLRRVDLPGGHPMHRDVDAVHAALLKAIDDSASGHFAP